MPNPTDAKGVQRCVGFVNYLSRFMPHLSEVCEPLRRLLDKEVPLHWLPKHGVAMKELKTLVMAVPVLHYYDVSKPVTIQSDSSQTGLGSPFSEHQSAFRACPLHFRTTASQWCEMVCSMQQV